VVEPGADRRLERVERFCEEVKEAYPTRSPLYVLPAGADRPEPVAITRGAGPPDGWALEPPDGRQAVHARTNGLAFYRLGPHGDWQGLREQAGALWLTYLRH